MTRRDFELITKTIRDLPPPARPLVAWRFAEALRSTNPRFDAERFLKACGVDSV